MQVKLSRNQEAIIDLKNATILILPEISDDPIEISFEDLMLLHEKIIEKII